MRHFKAIVTVTIGVALQACYWPDKSYSMEECYESGKVGELIMTERQKGTPLQEMLEVAKGDERLERVVLYAYDTPLYRSEEYKERAVGEFKDLMFKACYKVGRRYVL